MSEFETWISDVSADDRTGGLRRAGPGEPSRCRAAPLPLAAEKADEDVEHVHDLRVWTRRAGAALRLYEELLPRRRAAWMRKPRKRTRGSANDARDLDVLIGRLEKKDGEEHWLEDARSDRKEVQDAVVAVHRRLHRDHRFSTRIDKLLRRLRSRTDEGRGATTSRFGDWARERIQPFVGAFFAAVPDDPKDGRALHRFRIRGKELRYALELLEGGGPPRVRSELYPAIEELQDRLGTLNDLVTSRNRLRRKLEGTRGGGAGLLATPPETRGAGARGGADLLLALVHS